MARPVARFVPTQAHDRYLHLANRMRQTLHFHRLPRYIPRSDGFEVLILRYHRDRIVTLGLARMLTVGRIVRFTARLYTRWAFSGVARMWILMVALGRLTAGQGALGCVCFLLPPTRNLRTRSAAAGGDKEKEKSVNERLRERLKPPGRPSKPTDT